MWVWWSSAEKVRFILVLCEQLVSRFMTSSSPALASAGPAWTSPATLRTDSMVIFRTTPTVTSSSIVSFAPIVSMWNHVGSLGSKTGSPSTRKSTPLASNSAFCWLSLVLSAASCSLSSCSFFCSLFSFSAHHARSATLIAADTGPMILSAKLAPALAPLPIALAPPAAPSAAVVVAKVASPTVLATPTPTADSAATEPPPALPARWEVRLLFYLLPCPIIPWITACNVKNNMATCRGRCARRERHAGCTHPSTEASDAGAHFADDVDVESIVLEQLHARGVELLVLDHLLDEGLDAVDGHLRVLDCFQELFGLHSQLIKELVRASLLHCVPDARSEPSHTRCSQKSHARREKWGEAHDGAGHPKACSRNLADCDSHVVGAFAPPELFLEISICLGLL
mmetsp:Transcript_1712/g.3600  ORF Transcript_1712/g.3600 Transcript_1712/m.3600 type:complete len:398 (+) Transcript_1712:302-1495(+)